MNKDQIAFVVYEQADREFIAELLGIEIDDLDELEDRDLLGLIKSKVTKMNEKEIKDLQKSII